MPGDIDGSSIRNCENCGAPKIKISGILNCVNCSTLVEKESEYRNDFEDPGHEVMLKFLAGEKTNVPEVTPSVKSGKILTTTPIPILSHDSVYKAIETISKFFEKRPVADLAEAKRLIKLRKEIENLQAKIITFLGE